MTITTVSNVTFSAQCGADLSSSSKLRRDLVTLSHYDVLHILTEVQEPRCLIHQQKGVKADFFAVSQSKTL